MNRTARVLAVYRELRQSVGFGVPSSEVLSCAASLVELFSADADEPRFDTRLGGLPFEHQAVDVAFADGGWRVLSLEWADMCGDDTEGGWNHAQPYKEAFGSTWEMRA